MLTIRLLSSTEFAAPAAPFAPWLVSRGVLAAISHWWLRNDPPNAAWKKRSAMTYFGAPARCRYL